MLSEAQANSFSGQALSQCSVRLQCYKQVGNVGIKCSEECDFVFSAVSVKGWFAGIRAEGCEEGQRDRNEQRAIDGANAWDVGDA